MTNYAARVAVYERALAKYGAPAQMIVALEEFSEVQKEVCKLLRGSGSVEHLAEEIADATIMLEQLRMIYGIDARVCDYMDAKTQRLADRIIEQEQLRDIETITARHLAAILKGGG